MRFWYAIIAMLVLIACSQNAGNKNHVPSAGIALQPLGAFPESLTTALADSLRNTLHQQIVLLPKRPLPKQAYYQPRNRYRADTLIRLAAAQAHQSGYSTVVYLTVNDISHSNNKNNDYGIFGLGYQPGNGAAVSTFRLKTNYRSRLFKVVIHELGHNLGLPHCKAKACYMQDAHGKMVQDSLIGFCEACSSKLTHLRK